MNRIRNAWRILALWLVFSGLGLAAEFDHAHAAWTRLLTRHVHDGRVDYAGLKTQPAELNQYLERLAAVEQAEFDRWSAPHRLAFLCNAYNAWTLRLIVDHYPVKSIKEIQGAPSSPWDRPLAKLFGQSLTLNQLEQRMLGLDSREPRVHFALVCAARGCPPLRQEAYVGSRLNEQLADQARQFLAAPDKNRVDAQARIVYLSPVFKWYGGDFGSGTNEVLAAIKPYWPGQTGSVLTNGGFNVRYTEYDWSLNGPQPQP